MAYSKKQTSSNYVNRAFLNDDCLITSAFDTFSGRWTLQVIFCIHMGINRFSLLKGRLEKVSDHILGLRLNQLVENGLAKKKMKDGEMIYVLTEKGEGLTKILEDLTKWHTKK